MDKKVFINKVFHKKFLENGHYTKNESLLKFYRDLLKQYNFPVKEKMLEKGYQNNFIHISQTMLKTIDKKCLEDVDLVLLAHDTPDIDPSYSTTSYLSHKFDLGSRCIAITNLGKNVGLGTVNIAKELINSKRFNRILILLAEQNTLPYHFEETEFADVGIGVLLTSKPLGEVVFTIDEYEYIYFDDGKGPNLIKELSKRDFDPRNDLLIYNNQDVDIDQSYVHNYLSTNDSSRTLQSLLAFSKFVSQNGFERYSKVWLMELDPYSKKVDFLKINMGKRGGFLCK